MRKEEEREQEVLFGTIDPFDKETVQGKLKESGITYEPKYLLREALLSDVIYLLNDSDIVLRCENVEESMSVTKMYVQ
jgi:hypothetical protein